ncbi:hypothetical protein CF327_g5888 [Tilletia walkeri]|uniref:Transmembrane protein n=1 Tax=Tilletia walkeri TaxID=117179 RepID=A0A8X7N7N4_9BASI|nr:hypothetical protein CF327_g5888 [Tilletia walkeri]KAE8267504.1 hypothetical protein A4X09_0g4840 [Tilletia walkeri]
MLGLWRINNLLLAAILCVSAVMAEVKDAPPQRRLINKGFIQMELHGRADPSHLFQPREPSDQEVASQFIGRSLRSVHGLQLAERGPDSTVCDDNSFCGPNEKCIKNPNNSSNAWYCCPGGRCEVGLGCAQGSQQWVENKDFCCPINATCTDRSSVATPSGTATPKAILLYIAQAQTSNLSQPQGADNPASPGSSSNVTVHCRSSAGPAAGAGVGGVVFGILAGSFLVAFLLRRKQRNHQGTSSSLEKFSDGDSPMGTPALSVVPYRGADSSKAPHQASVDTSFGSKFDAKSEKELVEDLASYNFAVDQFSMAVTGNGKADSSKALGPLPRNIGPAAGALKNIKASDRAAHFEGVTRHIINSIAYQRVAQPFCFMADLQQAASLATVDSSVSNGFDQAQAARWRVMTHTAMRKTSNDPTAQRAIKQTQDQMENTMIEAVLWAGLETDAKAASARVGSSFGQVRDAVANLASLAILLREGMTSANYQIAIAPSNLAVVLGLVANPGRKDSRTIVPLNGPQ